MNRRTLFSALAAFPLLMAGFADPLRAAESDDAVLKQIEDYLNGIHTLRARFEQTAPDGAITHGTVWLERPGRMRFQYDPPTPLLLVATNGEMVFQDFQLHQTSRIPLDKTPLGILLAAHVSFSGDVAVRQLKQLPGEIQLSVVRRTDPGAGLLAIVFSGPSLALYQWTIVDPQQKITTVRLSDVQTGVKIDPALFQLQNPTSPPQP